MSNSPHPLDPLQRRGPDRSGRYTVTVSAVCACGEPVKISDVEADDYGIDVVCSACNAIVLRVEP